MLNQLLLTAFSLSAMILALSEDAALREWAPFVGLAGQPFWFIATIPRRQWGMVAVCVAYSAVYAHAALSRWL